MIPLNPWEHQNAIKALYSKCVETVCEEHNVTRMELDILLFLANNPLFDTASDIVEIRYLSKSQVSASIKSLEKKGFLRKNYEEDNRKTAHLQICEGASGVVAGGKAAQEEFVRIMFEGIPEEEIQAMRKCNRHMMENIHRCLKKEKAESDSREGTEREYNPGTGKKQSRNENARKELPAASCADENSFPARALK